MYSEHSLLCHNLDNFELIYFSTAVYDNVIKLHYDQIYFHETNIHLIFIYSAHIRKSFFKEIIEFLQVLSDIRYLIFLVLTEMSDLHIYRSVKSVTSRYNCQNPLEYHRIFLDHLVEKSINVHIYVKFIPYSRIFYVSNDLTDIKVFRIKKT